MLDWIFEGIVNWVSGIVSQMMDAVSGLFLETLGTDMVAMEEYFPFVEKAYSIMQYSAWAILFLITVWQLFRVFGGPITEAENPWILIARSALFALLIGYAKPIFLLVLDIARAPYTALMEVSMTAEDFTFAGVEQALTNGLTTIVSIVSVVGLLLLVILEISLGWNYFKLLLETVERYIVVGVLCYTSPLAYSMGASKATSTVFKSWCRMVGSQLLLLVMNVWFLRGFNSSMGQFIGNGGALSTGQGSIFLWLFCALAFLKTAQRFDSYLASIGLNVAQAGSSIPNQPVLYLAKDLKRVGQTEMNKTLFTRMTGAIFSSGSCYAVYNTRNAAMKWSGMGEFKALHSLTEAARLNAGISQVNAAVLLGQSEEIALKTLLESDKSRRMEFRFDAIYAHIYFTPMDADGIRQLRILVSPDWHAQMLDLLFEPETRSYGCGLFEYDACVDGVYVLSHLDGDLARLIRFREAIECQTGSFEVLCFPYQAQFLQEYIGQLAGIKTIDIDLVEAELCPERRDLFEG